MTNEEIDIILKKVNLEISNLQDLRNFLLDKKRKNNDEKRQNAFEKYLATPNILGSSSKIYFDPKSIIFSNGISIYIVRTEYFKINNCSFISNNKDKKFKIVEFREINKYVDKINNLYKKFENSCLLYESFGTVTAEWYDEMCGKLNIDNFYAKEVEFCDSILDEPLYRISESNPILKAESEIGKAYIIGKQRCQK